MPLEPYPIPSATVQTLLAIAASLATIVIVALFSFAKNHPRAYIARVELGLGRVLLGMAAIYLPLGGLSLSLKRAPPASTSRWGWPPSL